jgi:intracellular septation protein
MKILLDFLPLVFFFAAYKFWGIYVATAVLMAATVAQMAVVYWLNKKLSVMHKATLALILIFGALTLLLHNALFIKWKPTVLYAGMAIVLAVAQWGYRKNFLKIMLASQLTLPETVWHRLGAAWVAYCLFMAALNGYVAAFYSTGAWAAFKLWGYVFPVAFIVGQGVYVARYLQVPPKDCAQKPGEAP